MKRINYGIDAPVVIRNLLLIGIVLILAYIFFPGNAFPPLSIALQNTFITPGICLVICGLLMIAYSRFGKFKHRNRMLKMHEWKGSEQVLDVGTGLGLLMIGVAKKLTTGTSYGIDIFNNYDLSSNTRKQLQRNIEQENVGEKVKVLEENILETSFAANNFDVIVSNLCLHNLYKPEERQQACSEISRILKPGGKAIISDFKHTGQYAKVFKEMGMAIQKKGPYIFDTFPPLSIVIAYKP